MATNLTEQKVLKKLGIESFRNLTKDKVITMVSLLDRMDPEVAKKAIEQFPNFSNTMKEMVSENRQIITKGLESNDASVQKSFEAYKAINDALQRELEKETYSFEEKKYIIEQMKEIADKKDKKDTENKKFIFGMASLAAGVVITVGGALALALGGNTKIDLKN